MCHGPPLLARGWSHRAVVGCGARVGQATRGAGAPHANLRRPAVGTCAWPRPSVPQPACAVCSTGGARPGAAASLRPSAPVALRLCHASSALRCAAPLTRVCSARRASAAHPSLRAPFAHRKVYGAPAPRVSCPPSRAPHPPSSRCLRCRARTRRTVSRAPSGWQKHIATGMSLSGTSIYMRLPTWARL